MYRAPENYPVPLIACQALLEPSPIWECADIATSVWNRGMMMKHFISSQSDRSERGDRQPFGREAVSKIESQRE